MLMNYLPTLHTSKGLRMGFPIPIILQLFLKPCAWLNTQISVQIIALKQFVPVHLFDWSCNLLKVLIIHIINVSLCASHPLICVLHIKFHLVPFPSLKQLLQ